VLPIVLDVLVEPPKVVYSDGSGWRNQRDVGEGGTKEEATMIGPSIGIPGLRMTETFVDTNKITALRITCSGCQTQVTVTVSSRDGRPMLRVCPSCGKEYPQELSARFRSLGDVLRELQESNTPLELRIDVVKPWEILRRESQRPKDEEGK
jgi:hypothetical protein